MKQKIFYQCSNCGKAFTVTPYLGVAHGMYLGGCRAIGSAFYCDECVKTCKERNHREFDDMVLNPQKQFSDWWNETVERQISDKSIIKAARRLPNGDFVEVKRGEKEDV